MDDESMKSVDQESSMDDERMKSVDQESAKGEQNFSGNGGLDKLSDDLLIKILSNLNVTEAIETSAVASRWKHMWKYLKSLRFDLSVDQREIFLASYDALMKHHIGSIDGMYIVHHLSEDPPFYGRTMNSAVNYCWTMNSAVNKLVRFAVDRNVQILMLKMSCRHEFPELATLPPSIGSHPLFYHLKDLSLVNVDIKDEFIKYILESSPSLEELHLNCSYTTFNIKVIDPPNLRVLDIESCLDLESLEVSAARLVSLIFSGNKGILVLKGVPNLRELHIDGETSVSFLSHPKLHLSYSAQLEKLVLYIHPGKSVSTFGFPDLCSLKRLEVHLYTEGCESLLFFTSLIKASPQLREFVIEAQYPQYNVFKVKGGDPEMKWGFPVISDTADFEHNNLKTVQFEGYTGCPAENKFMEELMKIGPLIQKVVIYTKPNYPNTFKNVLVLNGAPNIRELCIEGAICTSFLSQPKLTSSYAAQLEKLVLYIRPVESAFNAPDVVFDLPLLCSLKCLEVHVCISAFCKLLFFTSLIKASPQLREFVIKVEYELMLPKLGYRWDLGFPDVSDAVKFENKNLKVVKFEGYIGSYVEEQFLRPLMLSGPLIQKVVLDTELNFSTPNSSCIKFDGASSRSKAQQIARHFVSKFLNEIEEVIVI